MGGPGGAVGEDVTPCICPVPGRPPRLGPSRVLRSPSTPCSPTEGPGHRTCPGVSTVSCAELLWRLASRREGGTGGRMTQEQGGGLGRQAGHLEMTRAHAGPSPHQVSHGREHCRARLGLVSPVSLSEGGQSSPWPPVLLAPVPGSYIVSHLLRADPHQQQNTGRGAVGVQCWATGACGPCHGLSGYSFRRGPAVLRGHLGSPVEGPWQPCD